MIQHPPPSPTADTALRQSEFLLNTTASRLSDQLRDPSGVDDYRQELTLHVLQRWDRYDPARGTARSFIRRVVQNHERDIKRDSFRERRGHRQTVQWPVSPHDGQLLDMIDQQSVGLDDRLDVESTIDELVDPERTICRLHQEGHAISDIAKLLKMSRGAVYRSLDFICERFEQRGLREYLHFPGAAEAKGVGDV